MEYLKYVNAIGQEATFSENSKYLWLSVDDLGANSVSFQTVASPYQDGETAIGTPYFDAKIISLKFAIVSNTVVSDMRSLNQILNPKLGMGQLQYFRDGITYILDSVKPKVLPTLPGGSERGSSFQKSLVIFEAFNPLYTDVDYTSATVGSGQLLFSFAVNITDTFEFDVLDIQGVIVQNTGDVAAPIRVQVDGEFEGPLRITNMTTGEKIVIQLGLTNDERLIITTDTENTNVLKETISTKVFVSAFNYIDITETEFFLLALGNNQILIESQNSEIVGAIIQYKNRYVGV